MKKQNKESGQVLILAIIVIGLVFLNTFFLIGGSQLFYQNTHYNVQSAQATNLAEAAVDKALASLNKSGGSYTGESETKFGTGSYTINITTEGANKVIEATGYIPSKTNSQVKRSIKITASKGIGIAFNYGVQVGEGGLVMSNNGRVNGSVYSNGNIKLVNNSQITGDAYVAGGIAPATDQESSCADINCSDFVFGKNVSGSDRLDVAQSFRPDISDYLTKVAVRLKKSGSPPDITIRILRDSGGKPDKTGVLATGVLPANLVTTNFSFIDVTFANNTFLDSGTTYWIVLDTSSNSSNYWIWSADTLQSYTRGKAEWSPNWQAKTPVWNNINADLDFKTYMGGVATYISGTNGAVIGGDAHANTLQNLAINKAAYYKVISGSTAQDYYPNSEDPPAKVMPVSEANISTWQSMAEQAGVYTGDINTCRPQLGPGKYVGNVSFTNGCTVTVRDPLWITGNLTLSNSAIMKLDSSYGITSGVMLVDGVINLANNVKIRGSGTAGSYFMAISNYDSRTNNQIAVNVSNSGNEGILCAPKGIVNIANNNHMTELTAWKIILGNNVIVDYDTGLSSTFFSSGPSGSYSLVKGTYQLK